ncbi:hypothetical protein GW17_00050093 [Ensete ventricosum]|nr:hypothetical protein GW17_00050093 [Ensete ventricosum]
MHPLRCRNSGIKAKLFYVLVVAIGNESKRCLRGSGGHLHAIEVAGHGQAPCMGGQPWPGYLQGVIGCGQGPLQRGDRLRPGPVRKGAAPARGQTAGAATRGWSAVARRPQGATAARDHAAEAAVNGQQTTARGQPTRGDRLRVRRSQEGSLRAEAPPARAAACRGGDHGGVGRRGGRPLAEWLLMGKGNRRQRRGSNDSGGGAVRVKEG